MDLDIGCRRPVVPLLVYPVILPRTIPVGISNDLMFAEKGHPFFKQTIESLKNFDYSWLLNYPTVMFSTGPMFLSVQYGLYVRDNFGEAMSQVRVLPKTLYGKNIKESEAPHSFFSHFYGSSWHSDDAAFIAFLNTWGKFMMWLGLFILVIGFFRLPFKPRRSFTRIAGYDIVFPSLSRPGRWYLHLGRHSFTSSLPQSPISEPSSPIHDLPVLHIPLDSEPIGRPSDPIMESFRQFRNRLRMVRERFSPPNSPVTPNRSRQTNRGVLFFLPAVFTTQSPDIALQPPRPRATRRVSASSFSRHRNGLPSRTAKGDPFQRDEESGLMQSSDNQENRSDWADIDEYVPNPEITLRRSSEDTAVDDAEPEEAWFSS